MERIAIRPATMLAMLQEALPITPIQEEPSAINVVRVAGINKAVNEKGRRRKHGRIL